jgi:hypothetical protein
MAGEKMAGDGMSGAVLITLLQALVKVAEQILEHMGQGGGGSANATTAPQAAQQQSSAGKVTVQDFNAKVTDKLKSLVAAGMPEKDAKSAVKGVLVGTGGAGKIAEVPADKYTAVLAEMEKLSPPGGGDDDI